MNGGVWKGEWNIGRNKFVEESQTEKKATPTRHISFLFADFYSSVTAAVGAFLVAGVAAGFLVANFNFLLYFSHC